MLDNTLATLNRQSEISATPEDVDSTISMLLRPDADFINCSIIYCDGGESRSGTL